MNETIITLAGWICSDPRLHSTEGGPVLHFRLAATPRRYNRRTGEWGDGETQWHRVTVWRALADNCARSLRRGQPVVVHGRLNATTFTTKEGEQVTTWEIEATHVGHDLNRGHTAFYRPKATAEAGPGEAPQPGSGPDWAADPGRPVEAPDKAPLEAPVEASDKAPLEAPVEASVGAAPGDRGEEGAVHAA